MDDAELDHFFNARSLTKNAQKPLPDFENIHTELKTNGVTLETLWQEYRAEHPTGYFYTHIARLYKRWARKLNISMRQSHRAGNSITANGCASLAIRRSAGYVGRYGNVYARYQKTGAAVKRL